MQPIQFRKFDKRLEFTLSSRKVKLPSDTTAIINENWLRLVRENPKLRNGEVFTVLDVHEDSKSMRVNLAETTYAHYLYSQYVGGLGDLTVRIIHPAALVIAGNKMIFGTMGLHTSSPGMIQCCGGGLDHDAVGPGGHVEIDRTMASELQEELDIDMYDMNLVLSALPLYLKSGGPNEKMALIYVVKLKQTSEQFLRHYEKFVSQILASQEQPEFSEIFAIDRDEETVEAFIRDHAAMLDEYMPILLRTASQAL